MRWPIFADVLSSLRNRQGSSALITHFDPILKVKNSIKTEAIIQFGDRIVSKTLGSWLTQQTPEFYLHVSLHPMREDPFHLVTHRVQCAPQIFTREVLSSLQQRNEIAWSQQWSTWDQRCQETLDTHFSAQDAFTEPAIIRELSELLNNEWSLFLANSMPIRDANQFLPAQNRCHAIFGNRGVSGIDGNIATAAGLAVGIKKPLLALIGDLTFLHDVNSLAILPKIQQPLILCVVNNGGGGIFSFLPISKRKEAFEEFIVAAHEMKSFGHAAELFGLPYFHPRNLEELRNVFSKQRQTPQTCIIEITTDRNENVRVHEHIITEIATCLNTADSPVEMPATLH